MSDSIRTSESTSAMQTIRNQMVNRMLVYLAYIVPVALAISLLRIIQHGWNPLFIVHISLGMAAILFAVFREKISFILRGIFLSGFFLLLAVFGLASFGLLSGSNYMLLFFAVMTGLNFGIRAGMFAAMFSALYTLGVGIAVHSGWMDFNFDIAEYANSWTVWSVMVIMHLIVTPLVIAVLGNFQTHFQESVQRLRKSDTQMRTLIETLPDMVWLKDPQGVYLSCNKKFEDFFGATESEIVGKTDYDFVEKELADAFRKNDRIAQESGTQSVNEEEVVFASDGHKELLETIKTPIFNDAGEALGVLAVARDITRRRVIESRLRQSQKLEAVGTMVGGIAHDFNNILQSTFLYGEVVESMLPHDPLLRQNFQHLLDDAIRARNLVDQILTFSRKSELQMQAQPIHAIILDSLKFMRASYPANIEIHQTIDLNCGNVRCDKTQVQQIILNLCNNAKQAMGSKGGKLTVSLQKVEPTEGHDSATGGVLELSVRDTGSGIDPEILDKIFDPFFTTKPVGEGSGLGLSVIHGVVQTMEGEILVKSDVGVGTSIEILLPVAEALDEDIILPGSDLPHKMFANTSLLIVDDEDAIRISSKNALLNRGFHAETASDGDVALLKFQRDPEQYDFIVTDLRMPAMSGIELTIQIRKTGSLVPIVLTTGNLDIDLKKEYEMVGVSAFLHKPWSADELIDCLESIRTRAI